MHQYSETIVIMRNILLLAFFGLTLSGYAQTLDQSAFFRNETQMAQLEDSKAQLIQSYMSDGFVLQDPGKNTSQYPDITSIPDAYGNLHSEAEILTMLETGSFNPFGYYPEFFETPAQNKTFRVGDSGKTVFLYSRDRFQKKMNK